MSAILISIALRYGMHLLTRDHTTFSARRYASAVYAVVVFPSLRLSGLENIRIYAADFDNGKSVKLLRCRQ